MWATLVAPIAALSLVLTACGSSGSGGGGGGGADLRGEQGKNDINAMDPTKLRDGGEFKWPVGSLSTQFNSNQVDGTELDNSEIISALMPSLFVQKADGSLEMNKDYLESAEITSTDPQVVTYKINPKAAWYDGTPITSEDFDAQYKALNGSNEAYLVSTTTGYEDIASVEQGADEREVKVTFKEKFAEWKVLFSLLFPKSTNSDPNVFNTGWTDQPLTTAGPFKFDSVDRTAKTLTLVRNEKWWGTTPRLSKIIYREVDIDSEGQAFANGEVDWVDIGPDVEKFNQVKQTANAAVRVSTAPNFRHLTFNGAPGSILEDPALRIAIQKAIDRETIAKAMVGPIVPDVKPLNNHFYAATLKDYKDNAGVVSFDQAAAAKALDDLGWKLDGAVRKKDGKELVIRDIIPTAVAVSANEAKIVADNLSKVGVKLNIETVPSNDFFKEFVNKGNFDMTHFSWIGTATPISSGTGIYELDPANLAQNYGRIGNDTVNDLLKRANAELDDAKRAELANQADEEIWKLGHSLLTYSRPNAVGVRSNVANFGAFGFANNPIKYTDIGFVS